MQFITPKNASKSVRITSSRDPLRMIISTAGILLAVITAAVRPGAAASVAAATARPFATLAAIILASALAERLGAFRILSRGLIPARGPRVTSAAAVLALTALLSALINLDVAVVVGMPVAMRTAVCRGLPAGRLAVAVAVMANAASFLLPTSNITNLLLLGRVPLATPAYLSDSWLAWILVTALTLAPLAWWAASTQHGQARAAPARPSARAVLDLVPLFLIATGIRALLGTSLALHGSFTSQLAHGTILACVASNLPAAAAILPAGARGLWAAILASTIGPNLLITGSVATLISRRIARDAGPGSPPGSSAPSGSLSSQPSSPPLLSACTSPAHYDRAPPRCPSSSKLRSAIQTDTWAGSSAWCTTSARSSRTDSRSTVSFSRAANAATVRSASYRAGGIRLRLRPRGPGTRPARPLPACHPGRRR
jgi:Na+/H+ antiporter NhaD/arsenite permease-like protein